MHDPIAEIPYVAEADDTQYRVIHLPNQVWKCSPIAALENLFDNAHHHYVHTLLGDRGSPEPLKPEVIQETDDGIYFKSDMRNHTTSLQRNVWGIEDDEIILDREFIWHMPFFARITLRLPNGLRNVTLILFSPISKSETLWTNIVFRNDSANPSATAEDIIKLGLAIGAEDQAILETLHLNVPLEPKMQQHMATDKPGIIMRRKFSDLLRLHEEVENSPNA
ncbi:hypothetical protein [Streptomyces lavendulocolor]|uniref:hypothetical protein n=1 Tax=Streptomyces lavendulocolor TaxID=67316 RepID=UPI0033C1887A